MRHSSKLPPETRLGFHYFPDSVHYRQADLNTWLPELAALGARWITLIAPLERAIPEFFLEGLLAAGIQPILHFQSPGDLAPDYRGLQTLLEHYARWGVRYVALYDRPNCRAKWRPAAWAQVDLVERFLDLFIPLAETAQKLGLTPVFPPLEPGGDYWDLAFLRTALRGMQRRGCVALLDALALGAYAWVGDRPLNWGAGGAARWEGVRPYFTPPDAQDHLGFRIFDWYLEVASQELGGGRPLLLLRAGSCPAYDAAGVLQDGAQHALQNLALARLAAGLPQEGDPPEPLPSEVLACNFWLLAAGEGSAHAAQAWFRPDGEHLPVVDALRRWAAGLQNSGGLVGTVPRPGTESDQNADPAHPIEHYVLLPLYAWGPADWDLAAIQPLLRASSPTIGFSLTEARQAARVTVVGGQGAFSEQALEVLRAFGCRVERLLEDGTLVAT